MPRLKSLCARTAGQISVSRYDSPLIKILTNDCVSAAECKLHALPVQVEPNGIDIDNSADAEDGGSMAELPSGGLDMPVPNPQIVASDLVGLALPLPSSSDPAVVTSPPMPDESEDTPVPNPQIAASDLIRLALPLPSSSGPAVIASPPDESEDSQTEMSLFSPSSIPLQLAVSSPQARDESLVPCA